MFFATAQMTACMSALANHSGLAVLEMHSRKTQVRCPPTATHARLARPQLCVSLMCTSDVSFGDQLSVNNGSFQMWELLVLCPPPLLLCFFLFRCGPQSYRDKVSAAFRGNVFGKGPAVLFTSNVSARGVDYPDVTHVIQVRINTLFEGEIGSMALPFTTRGVVCCLREYSTPTREKKEIKICTKQ